MRVASIPTFINRQLSCLSHHLPVNNAVMGWKNIIATKSNRYLYALQWLMEGGKKAILAVPRATRATNKRSTYNTYSVVN